jgi:hypothetical protein
MVIMMDDKKHANTEAQRGNRNAAKPDGLGADCFVHARCLCADKGRWNLKARAEGLKLTEWIVKTLNAAL